MTARRNREERRREAVSPARRAAFEVLRSVEERRGEPAGLLHAPRYRSLATVDRDLSMEIVLGVLRFRGSLDFVLAHHVERPLERLDPRLLTALRIGLYQIRHLDRVPDRAAVDEAVRLARAFGASRGAGLVNAVLRSILREPDSPSFPDKEEDPIGYLSTALSHPRFVAERYLERLGLDGAEARCLRQNQPPPIHLRVTDRIDLAEARDRLAAESLKAEILAEVPGCLRVVSGSLAETSLFREGLVFPQDAGSQLVALLLSPRRADRILDVCAAPGGKAAAASERAPEGAVFAMDVRARRVRLLRDLAARLGRTNVHVLVADGRRLPFDRTFDRVLLDVPCTGLGTLRRNPDIKWRVSEADLKRLPVLQRALLDSASRLLARGGRLVYSTCSTEPEENEEVIDSFLSERPDLALVDVRESLPEPAHRFAAGDGSLRTLPERDDMDGYYAVILEKTQEPRTA